MWVNSWENFYHTKGFYVVQVHHIYIIDGGILEQQFSIFWRISRGIILKVESKCVILCQIPWVISHYIFRPKLLVHIKEAKNLSYPYK